MNTDYDDIRSRIAGPPAWFDEAAVPRYAPFHPSLLANIYADEAVLLQVRCPGCQTEFHVAVSGGGGQVKAAITGLDLEYGDPPNIGCCARGPSMPAVTVRVLEYWLRSRSNLAEGWRRDTEFERTLPSSWIGKR